MVEPRINVTLVHGTWAPNAGWIREGSKMTSGLGGGVVCHSFGWSGHNSHRARIRAADALACHLRSQHEQEPDVPQAVVAHSHGGNIAVHAVWGLLRVQDAKLPVVTMATPFLFANRKRVYPLVMYAAAIVAVGIIAMGVLVAVLAVGARDFGAWPVTPFGVVFVTAWVVSLVQLVALVFWMVSHGPPWQQGVQNRFISDVSAPAADDGGLLIIRAADDEASATLAVTQVSTWVSTLATRLTRPLAWSIAYAVIIVSSLILAVVLSEDMVGLMGFVGGLVATVTFLFSFVVVSVPALFSIGHGLDGPTASLFALVTAEATPPGYHVVRQRPIKDADDTGLSHSSLYEDRDVIGWISTHIQTAQRRS